jgi:hypothetical protein
MNWQVSEKKELKEKYGVEKGDIEKRRNNLVKIKIWSARRIGERMVKK